MWQTCNKLTQPNLANVSYPTFESFNEPQMLEYERMLRLILNSIQILYTRDKENLTALALIYACLLLPRLNSYERYYYASQTCLILKKNNTFFFTEGKQNIICQENSYIPYTMNYDIINIICLSCVDLGWLPDSHLAAVTPHHQQHRERE